MYYSDKKTTQPHWSSVAPFFFSTSTSAKKRDATCATGLGDKTLSIPKTSSFGKRQNGFTLIETLIYIALMAILIGGSLVAVYGIIEGTGETSARIVIEEEANFILRKLEWALTGVSTINSPAIGATGSVLSVSKFNFSPNPVVIDLSADTIRIKRGTGAAQELNSVNVKITSLTFSHIAPSAGKPEAVKVTFVLNGRTFETIRYVP